MKVKNIYRSKSDFNNMSKSEFIALTIATPLYQSETEHTERIKEKSLPLHTLFNCVATITQRLKNEELPELFIDEIWDDIKHIRGKEHKERPLANLLSNDYDFNVNRWYEATVIFACVYIVIMLDCPEKHECLRKIKSKAAYNGEAENYFIVFEKKLAELQIKTKANPEAYGNPAEETLNETKTYTEDEWIASEKHDSWRLDKLRKEVTGKPIEEQFQLYIAEMQHEQSLSNPSKIYQNLLDIQIRALQKQMSEKNEPTIKINDILQVFEQNNFPNQKKAELLEVINYVLYSKQYPDDICGNLEKKIQLLKQAEQEATAPANSNLQLSSKKGFKVNFIRVINCLFELSFFTDRKGNDITKKEVFDTFGKAINQDLSTFHNDLSATKAAANHDMQNTLVIFNQMHDKQVELNKK